MAISDLEAAIRRDDIEKTVVGAVILERDPAAGVSRVLLLERASSDYLGGLIELPSGGIAPGEALLAALDREVFEETGLRLRGTPRFVGAFDYASRSGRRTRQLNFAAAPRATTVTLNPAEHCAYHWVTAAELDDLAANVSVETRSIIRTAFALAPDV